MQTRAPKAKKRRHILNCKPRGVSRRCPEPVASIQHLSSPCTYGLHEYGRGGSDLASTQHPATSIQHPSSPSTPRAAASTQHLAASTRHLAASTQHPLSSTHHHHAHRGCSLHPGASTQRPLPSGLYPAFNSFTSSTPRFIQRSIHSLNLNTASYPAFSLFYWF